MAIDPHEFGKPFQIDIKADSIANLRNERDIGNANDAAEAIVWAFDQFFDSLKAFSDPMPVPSRQAPVGLISNSLKREDCLEGGSRRRYVALLPEHTPSDHDIFLSPWFRAPEMARGRRRRGTPLPVSGE
jgi:hypothetical protein